MREEVAAVETMMEKASIPPKLVENGFAPTSFFTVDIFIGTGDTLGYGTNIRKG